jgi:hypothetical protein
MFRGLRRAMVWAVICGAPAACARKADDASVAAWRVLEGARRALGGDAVDSVETIFSCADVEGPHSENVTMIWSARDGRARMEQSGGFIGVERADDGWQFDPDTGERTPLDAGTRFFIRGHELHAAALFPLTRYAAPRFAGEDVFRGTPALAVVFEDDLGDSVVAW